MIRLAHLPTRWLALLMMVIAGPWGCAVAPSPPPGGAPVINRNEAISIDRSAIPPPPAPVPIVEPIPLPQESPIRSETVPVPGPIVREEPDPEPPVAMAPTPPPPPPRENPAVRALLREADTQLKAGQLDKAAAALERALRIEPRNPSIWYDLGQIRLEQAKFDQAESLATKSNSLAAGNRRLQRLTWELIARARRLAGDGAGASMADDQAALLGP